MIKKSLYLLPFVVSAFANAQDGFYTSLYSGATFSAKSKTTTSVSDSVNLKTAPVFGAAVGYNYQDASFELSYDTRSSDDDANLNQKMKTNLLLANAVYNFNIARENIKPYVGFGVGFAQSELSFAGDMATFLSSDGFDTHYTLKNAFAMQLKGGAKMYLTPNVAIFSDLRYTNISNASYENQTALKSLLATTSEVKGSLNYFSVNVGVSYLF